MSRKIFVFVVGFIFGFVLFYLYSDLEIFNRETEVYFSDESSELHSLTPIEKTMKRIKIIRNLCGDLCDTTKKVTPGDFMGTITAKVDCQTLFQSPVLYQPSEQPPQSWGQLPPELQEMYTYDGRVKMEEFYFNTAFEGEGRNEATVFSKEHVENYITAWLEGRPADSYINGSNIVAGAADYVDVTGKTVLVMGTQNPWVEAVLLSRRPKKVVTLEYGYFISEYPGYSFMRPREFRERFLNKTLDSFDVIFTYSSLEHSGQGRYGDALNPWGDILAVAEAWCVSSENAVLAMGVPTMVGKDSDINAFNAHRIYGPVMYPFLTTNWKFVWPTRDEERVSQNPNLHPSGYQPVFVFKKTNGGV